MHPHTDMLYHKDWGEGNGVLKMPIFLQHFSRGRSNMQAQIPNEHPSLSPLGLKNKNKKKKKPKSNKQASKKEREGNCESERSYISTTEIPTSRNPILASPLASCNNKFKLRGFKNVIYPLQYPVSTPYELWKPCPSHWAWRGMAWFGRWAKVETKRASSSFDFG